MLLYHVILGIMGLTWLFEKSARLGVSESHCAVSTTCTALEHSESAPGRHATCYTKSDTVLTQLIMTSYLQGLLAAE